jgi:hypothetical protein
MIIHENEDISLQAIETIKYLQIGGTEDDVNEMIRVYESMEAYELCQGLLLGLEYFKSKVFNCRVGHIYEQA